MNGSLGKRVARGLRWTARILGTLIGLVALGEFVEGVGYPGQPMTSVDLMRIGFLLVFAGCVVGWFKEFAAALVILGGTALLCMTALLRPGAPEAIPIFVVPALIGFLFLYVRLAGNKEKRCRMT